MSWQTVQWVLNNSPSKGNKRLVMIVLAERANADGTEIWPSHADTAKRANMSRRRVVDAVKLLEESGELERVGLGPKGVVKYRMPMTVTKAHTYDENDTGCDENGSPGVTFLTEGCADTSHKPSGEPSFKPSKEPFDDSALKEEKTSSLTDTDLTQQASTGAPAGGGFVAFMEKYPRKHLDGAESAFATAVAREGEASIELRAKWWALKWECEDTPEKFIPYPANFLIDGESKWAAIPIVPLDNLEQADVARSGYGLVPGERELRQALAVYPYDPITSARLDAWRSTETAIREVRLDRTGTERFDQSQAKQLAEFKLRLASDHPDECRARQFANAFPFDPMTESRGSLEAVAA